MSAEENKEKECEFTKIEKKTLLTAMKQYGHKDIKKITEKLPNKSEQQVEAFINSAISQLSEVEEVNGQSNFKMFLKGQQKKNEDQFNAWSTYIENKSANDENDEFNTMSFVLKLIGSQIPVEDGIDFASMYRFLQAITEGQKPPVLNKEAADLVYHATQQIAQEFKSKPVIEKKKEFDLLYGGSKKYEKKLKSKSGADQQMAFLELLQAFDSSPFKSITKESKKN